MLLLNVFTESKLNAIQYKVLTIADMIRGGRLNLPYVPGISIDFASHSWLPPAIEVFCVVAYALLLFKPQYRTSYLLVLAALILRNTMSHLSVGVHTTSIYLMPFLILAIEPPRESNADKLRTRLIAAISLMYLFSSLNKLNGYYLSGHIVDSNFIYRLSMKSFSDALASFSITPFIGPGLEFLAFFMVFEKTRKLGVAAAFLFHITVSFWIFLSVPLAFFGYSLIFLLVTEKKLSSEFLRFVLLSLALFLGLYAMTEALSKNHLIFDVFSLSICAMGAYVAFSFLIQKKLEKRNYISFLGFGLPIAYVFLAFAGRWPEPFGYTQYAGRPNHSYIAVFPNNAATIENEFSMIGRRWRVIFRKDPEANEFVAHLPARFMRDELIHYFCQREPNANVQLFHSVLEPRQLRPDFDFRTRISDPGTTVPCTKAP